MTEQQISFCKAIYDLAFERKGTAYASIDTKLIAERMGISTEQVNQIAMEIRGSIVSPSGGYQLKANTVRELGWKE